MATSPASVLVVDDFRDAADSTALLLAVGGHDARAAYSCSGAVAAVGRFRPDVVVCELALPDGDAGQLARSPSAALGYRPAVAVVTGWSGRDADARAAGCDHQLVKPAPPDALFELVARSGHTDLRAG